MVFKVGAKMTAGVVIDKYKLETFKLHLDKAGYKYAIHETKTTFVLEVECEFASDLKPVIQAANDATKKDKRGFR